MRIVVVGDGKVGSALTEMLTEEGHDVVVIDSNKKVLRDALQETDVMVVHGNGAALAVQMEADVTHSDLFVAVTTSDETNLWGCMLARKLGCPHTIARVRNADYASQLFLMKAELGLSMTVNPELSAASEIFRLLQFPSFLHRDSFAKGRVEIVQIEVREGSKLIDKPISEMYKTAKVRALVCAVERGEKTYVPDGKFKLKQHDIVYVTASSHDLARLIRNLDIGRRKIRGVTIVGGGNIAVYLARDLLEAGTGVKIIELNEARAEQLAELLPGASIINADGADRRILDAEGIKYTDAVVALTGIDEENLIVSMYADHVGVPKVITKMNRMEYYEIFRDRGIGSVVSPKELVSYEITRYVRAMHSATADEVITMHKVGDMDALEFRAGAQTMYLGVPLQNVKLREGFLIACVNHQGEIVIPKGDTALAEDDTVIVVTTSDRTVLELNEIFAEPERKPITASDGGRVHES